VKLVNTYILFDKESVCGEQDWIHAHGGIARAIISIKWPDVPEAKEFRIPRIVKVKPGNEYTDATGSRVRAGEKGRVLRNGVTPIKEMFRRHLVEGGWTPEAPLSLKAYFQMLRKRRGRKLSDYPGRKKINKGLNEGVGDFDFWFSTQSGFRIAIEWETGNISSSHRSVNKMCMALEAELIDAAVLVVPSWYLYPHLTDRIGNVRELQPYFYFWNGVGKLIKKGVLAVMEVEHDNLYESSDVRDFIPIGSDGNSQRARE
jgi:hypothetical protein